MSILRQETGRRVVVRHRLADGSATDVLGDLQSSSEQEVTVLPDFAAAVTVSADDVIAVRDVPPRVVRPASRLEAITRVLNAGWPGLERRRLGGWLLTASGGYTGRANSCLPVGDPGLNTPDALDVVERFYAERGLPSKVQLSSLDLAEPAGPLEIELNRRGYLPGNDTDVLITELRGRTTETAMPSTVTLHWSDRPDVDWLGLHPSTSPTDPSGRAGQPGRATALAVLTAVPDAHFLLVRDAASGDPIGCARVVTAHGWAGVTALFVRDEWRRRGLGRLMLEQALAQAAAEGARFAYLQVERTSPQAHRLYRAAGFTAHHGYRYWTRPQN